MIRLQFFLIVGLVLSSLGLITSQHEARQLFIDVERLQNETRQLETEWNQLRTEQSAAAQHGLIETRARRELRMVPVTPDRTLYIDLNSPSGTIIAPSDALIAPSKEPAKKGGQR